MQYGLKCDGVTDDTSALNALLALVYAAGGGRIMFPAAAASNVNGCLINGQIVIPNDGATIPSQPVIRLSGVGSSARGQLSGTQVGGSILTMTYNGGIGKLVSYGIGQLEIDHLVIRELPANTAHTTPFIFVTNTTLKAHNNAFYGATNNSGTTCVQDVFIFGGVGSSSTGDSTGWFQGYGTVIRDNFADYVRRFSLQQSAANNLMFDGNTVWIHSGSALANGGAFEMNGALGAASSGSIFLNNLIEFQNYPYGFSAFSSNTNIFIGNGTWDAGVGTLGAYYLSGSGNVVIDGHTDFLTGNPVTGAGGYNTYIGNVGGAAYNWNYQTASNIVQMSFLKDYNAHTIISNLPPTVVSGFGTGPTITGLISCAFTITIGTGGTASSGVIQMPAGAWHGGWACHATNVTSNATLVVSKSALNLGLSQFTLTSYSRTTGVVTAFNAGDVIECICFGY